jgi:anti-sigma factor RsiW
MNCPDLQQNLPLYLDGQLSETQSAGIEAHLPHCPVCRAEAAELRSLTRDLALLTRPAPPPELAAMISRAVSIEVALAQQAKPRASWLESLGDWLGPRLLPYSVGAVATVMLFFLSFAALGSSLTALNDWDYQERRAIAREYRQVYGVDFPGFDISQPVTPEGLAVLRHPVGGESPTLNPQGALLSVMRSLAFGAEDDEMMVVADIFSDGSASLSGVMQPPRNPRMLINVQRALRKNAAFVPATFDNRPATLRVVFVVQSIDVREQ